MSVKTAAGSFKCNIATRIDLFSFVFLNKVLIADGRIYQLHLGKISTYVCAMRKFNSFQNKKKYFVALSADSFCSYERKRLLIFPSVHDPSSNLQRFRWKTPAGSG